jgi:hypothetical protein
VPLQHSASAGSDTDLDLDLEAGLATRVDHASLAGGGGLILGFQFQLPDRICRTALAQSDYWTAVCKSICIPYRHNAGETLE